LSSQRTLVYYVFFNLLPRWGAVFALFIPYFSDIPRVAVTHVWGIPVTGKSVTYIIGLQVGVGSRGWQILNCQTFEALPRCRTYSFTSLAGRFYAGSAIND